MIQQPYIDALKKSLRNKKITYSKLAEMLDISEASVRRVFSEGTFTLERFLKICDLAGITFEDIAGMRDLHRKDVFHQLSRKEEQFFAQNISYFAFLEMILIGRSPNDIAKEYKLSGPTLVKMLGTLEKMSLIEWLPDNEAKGKVGMRISPIPNGPLIQAFEKESIHDFVDSTFEGESEFKTIRLFKVSPDTLKRVLQRCEDFITEIGRDTDLDERMGIATEEIGGILAIRPWKDPFYNQLMNFEA